MSGGGKRIADPVHGTIALSAVETEIISTRAFQRLRGVKHLGLASLVFPGADYSRFSHGVGTSFVTSQIIKNLQANATGPEAELTEEQASLYRMAALLHDIGHYPFSHTLERAIKNHYSTTMLLKPVDAPASNAEDLEEELPDSNFWLHEELGEHVIKQDQQLSEILARAGIDADELSRIIRRIEPPQYANLVSSDLDADRIDYLMRTALHTGLPYGAVDLDYLLSQIRLDNDRRICFTPKGMRAAEHLLISRYFDYQQISFHKTVQGLELVLNEAVGVLLRAGLLDCSPSGLTAMITDNSWAHFDDAHVLAHMRAASSDGSTSDKDRQLLDAVLQRRPPKVLVDREMLGGASVEETFTSLQGLANAKMKDWENEYDLRFWVWLQEGTSLTKIGSRVQASAVGDVEGDMYDKLEQAVRVLDPATGESGLLQENSRSLVKILSEYSLYGLRVYALIPEEREGERDAITARVDADLYGFLK